MKKMFFWLWLLLKRQLKSPAMLAFLIGMPLVCLALSQMPAMNESGIPRVALFVGDGDEVALDTMTHLVKGDYSVEFYVAASREQLDSDVGQGIADHGYYFKDSFSYKLKSGDSAGSIELVQASSSGMLPSMTKEIVFSELFRVYAIDIAVDYIENDPMFDAVRKDAVTMVRANYEKYGNSDTTFHVDFEVLDNQGNAVQMEAAKVTFPIRGVLAILVFIAGLYGGVWWKSEKRKGVFIALPTSLAKMSRFLYILVPTVLFAASAEVTLAFTKNADYPTELVKMLCYIIAITVFVALLTAIIPDEKLMVSVIPVFAIACLVLCPVFVDLRTVSPVFRYIGRLLLPYYYII